MQRDWKAEIAHRLQDCKSGQLSLHLLGQHNAASVMLEQHLTANMEKNAQAHLDILEVYPGVELFFQTYSAQRIAFHHDHPNRPVMEINHCRTGRIGWTMQERRSTVSWGGRCIAAWHGALRTVRNGVSVGSI